MALETVAVAVGPGAQVLFSQADRVTAFGGLSFALLGCTGPRTSPHRRRGRPSGPGRVVRVSTERGADTVDPTTIFVLILTGVVFGGAPTATRCVITKPPVHLIERWEEALIFARGLYQAAGVRTASVQGIHASKV